ncbi:MAG: protein translocase subunit SecF [Ruminococcaceae bacterium]|nr:protein translocase subunit SecF [Oscillospiraceae bacterium]
MFNKEYNFLKHSKLYYIISSAIVVVAILVTAIFGLNIDIEFKGGSIATYSLTQEVKTADVEALVKDTIGHTAKARISENNVTGKQNVVISIADEISSEEQIKLTNEMTKKFKAELVESSSVNAMNGSSFFVKCLIAVILAAILMVVYIAFRFKNIGGWSAGVTAVLALVHDLIVTFAVYAIFRIEIGGNFMAVMLTILGYSINDTIVVFDRVRENKDNFGRKMSIAENVNTSLNQSLQRAINTTATTLIALTVVIVVSLIYNITSMFAFIFPMAVGLVSGVYSSMLLAPCVWVEWQQKLESKNKIRIKRK